MQRAVISNLFLATNAGQGQSAPENVNDYLGRLVVSSRRTHTVVRVEPSTRTLHRFDGTVVPGAARLYIALADGPDGRPIGHWTEADTIAAPGLTVLHWDHHTDYRADPDDCEALYQAATTAENARQQERALAHQQRLAEEARCEKLWQKNKPEWAKGYLVAELRQDECDTMTDYFHYSIGKTVFLGFTKSDRNNFAEMRKAAASYAPTARLASEGTEHRENYSGGSGYYLGGPSSYSGWTIRKHSLKYGLPRGSRAVMDFSHCPLSR